ncbi:MAG: SoxR reducing system RseC family protein [Firmicutes bacterium]|jgi:positive regulator of sigma E activity|nr:SoxR reducing system RseC family protein [Bacillota bacterium]
MIKRATIIKVENGCSYAITERKGSCGSKCDTCKHKCHNNVLEIEINSDNYVPGQEIDIQVQEKATILWLFLIYGGSLILFFLSIFIGEYFKSMYNIDSEFGPIIIAIIIIAIYWFILYKRKSKYIFYKIKG